MYALDKSPVLCRWAILIRENNGEPHERVPNSNFLCRQLTLEIQRVLEIGRLVVWKLITWSSGRTDLPVKYGLSNISMKMSDLTIQNTIDISMQNARS